MARGKLITFLTLAMTAIWTGGAGAVTVGGGLAEWGLQNSSGAYTPFTASTVGSPNTGQKAGTNIWYWEEKGAVNNWGYVQPGYGGYHFDIQGLYFTYNSNAFYIAAVLGMPPEGAKGLWNDTEWGEKEYLGDIAISLDGTAGSFEYALETLNGDKGKLFGGVSSWSSPNVSAYSASGPVNYTSGADTGLGRGFVYESLGTTTGTGTNQVPLYYIEAEFQIPSAYAFTPVDIHLTQTCGNDVGNLSAAPAPVPEPGTMVLLGTGLVGLAGWGRKKFRK